MYICIFVALTDVYSPIGNKRVYNPSDLNWSLCLSALGKGHLLSSRGYLQTAFRGLAQSVLGREKGDLLSMWGIIQRRQPTP